MEDDQEEKVGFWKKFAGEPCVRQSYLYAGTAALVVGSLSFMFTSNVRLSLVRGLGTHGTTLGLYWVYCRYNYFKEQEELKRISEVIANKALTLGVDPDDAILSKIRGENK